MDDLDLESLLRAYRPAGPTADLEARLLAPPLRIGPWAAAAAALLALTVGLQTAAPSGPVRTPDPGIPRQIDRLASVLGGGASARHLAALVVQQDETETARAQADALRQEMNIR
ncbi:MAG TPA: hypothetical protein VFX12_12605 [Vicinamibacterales bacterium]|nr:hypothetical protein [Vicinamibacterales bacterium]